MSSRFLRFAAGLVASLLVASSALACPGAVNSAKTQGAAERTASTSSAAARN